MACENNISGKEEKEKEEDEEEAKIHAKEERMNEQEGDGRQHCVIIKIGGETICKFVTAIFFFFSLFTWFLF